MRQDPGKFTGLLLVALLAASSASAETVPPSPNPLADARGGEICAAVKDAIHAGMETRAVVRTAVALGHPPCTVVRCALLAVEDCEAGEVIRGAREASVPPEVVARCAVDSCADPAGVAAVLAEAGPRLCYFEPPRTTGGSDLEELPLRDPLPPEKPRGDISPHTFKR